MSCSGESCAAVDNKKISLPIKKKRKKRRWSEKRKAEAKKLKMAEGKQNGTRKKKVCGTSRNDSRQPRKPPSNLEKTSGKDLACRNTTKVTKLSSNNNEKVKRRKKRRRKKRTLKDNEKSPSSSGRAACDRAWWAKTAQKKDEHGSWEDQVASVLRRSRAGHTKTSSKKNRAAKERQKLKKAQRQATKHAKIVTSARADLRRVQAALGGTTKDGGGQQLGPKMEAEKEHRVVAIDIEAWERNHSKILEIGVSTVSFCARSPACTLINM